LIGSAAPLFLTPLAPEETDLLPLPDSVEFTTALLFGELLLFEEPLPEKLPFAGTLFELAELLLEFGEPLLELPVLLLELAELLVELAELLLELAELFELASPADSFS
jgi:hypothetical protein